MGRCKIASAFPHQLNGSVFSHTDTLTIVAIVDNACLVMALVATTLGVMALHHIGRKDIEVTLIP